ncbi:MAG TPA: hypothetical protein VNL77_16840 [Roseiflexaceae bacterium]|nr:hypothetical protein [Roseiflexaceae bacterium]
MPEYTLTVIDATGIQDYIFGSNRVPENVGASQLVHQATTAWVRNSLPSDRHNLNPDDTINTSRQLEADDTLDAEVILRGGGNVLILFRSPTIAREAVSKLTRRALTDAPGLELAVAHHTFAWDTPVGGEDGAHRQLYARLNQAKQQRRRSAPLMGLGVTLECRATGMPAVGFDEDGRPVSANVLAKLAKGIQNSAHSRLTTMFPLVERSGYLFRRDFGALGGTEGEMSYIAVVHADGNGIGKRFERVINDYPNAAQNRDCLNALRALSEAVDAAGRDALQATVRRMMEVFQSPAAGQQVKDFLHNLHRDPETGRPILPFRPIVYGGDDVTFVCDGRLGLTLAAIYLEEWERATAENQTIGPAYACAGVAVVKTHYPFVRAYELAAELSDKAKKAIRDTGRDASALDWHFAMSGIGGGIEQIRAREYVSMEGQALNLRPLPLREPILKPDWSTWTVFDRVTRTFQNDEYWRERRNKVKELREVLRQGSVAVKEFRHAYTLKPLPPIDTSKRDLQEQGWFGGACGYFDAIEALDFYLPLTEER